MSVPLIKAVDRIFGGILVRMLLRPKTAIPKNPKAILCIQLWGIGETLLTLPAIERLKKSFPKAKVDVLCTDRVKDVYEGQSFIHGIHVIRTEPFTILGFILKNQRAYDLVIDFEEYLNVSTLIAWSSAPSIGYANQPRSRLYSRSIPYNDRQHITETHMDLIRVLKQQPRVGGLIAPKIEKSVESKMRRRMPKGQTIVIAPGAAESSKSRMWPSERYVDLINRLPKNGSIILMGTHQEASLVNTIQKGLKRKSTNLAGKLSVKEVFAVIKNADLVISNDSGAMHMGAALGVPTIGLFGPNLPVRWAPFGAKNASIYHGDCCKYSPCINVHKGEVPECLWGKAHENYVMCMKAISVDEVYAQALLMLARKI